MLTRLKSDLTVLLLFVVVVCFFCSIGNAGFLHASVLF